MKGILLASQPNVTVGKKINNILMHTMYCIPSTLHTMYCIPSTLHTMYCIPSTLDYNLYICDKWPVWSPNVFKRFTLWCMCLYNVRVILCEGIQYWDITSTCHCIRFCSVGMYCGLFITTVINKNRQDEGGNILCLMSFLPLIWILK